VLQLRRDRVCTQIVEMNPNPFSLDWEWTRLAYVLVGCSVFMLVYIARKVLFDTLRHQVMTLGWQQRRTEKNAETPVESEISGCPFASVAKPASGILAELKAKNGRVIMLCAYTLLQVLIPCRNVCCLNTRLRLLV
jgi:hypothetical protein